MIFQLKKQINTSLDLSIIECLGPRMANPQILKMKAFLFSIRGDTLVWLVDLPMVFIISWKKIAPEFLFYPITRVMSIRSEVSRI